MLLETLSWLFSPARCALKMGLFPESDTRWALVSNYSTGILGKSSLFHSGGKVESFQPLFLPKVIGSIEPLRKSEKGRFAGFVWRVLESLAQDTYNDRSSMALRVFCWFTRFTVRIVFSGSDRSHDC
ncbi:MAG: hypothetical protein DWI02_02400 [Planctomycetota bacterium]|nr:MAG: hypothetical protein DWI02_02400 [Planctomycetota bacterium]